MNDDENAEEEIGPIVVPRRELQSESRNQNEDSKEKRSEASSCTSAACEEKEEKAKEVHSSSFDPTSSSSLDWFSGFFEARQKATRPKRNCIKAIEEVWWIILSAVKKIEHYKMTLISQQLVTKNDQNFGRIS